MVYVLPTIFVPLKTMMLPSSNTTTAGAARPLQPAAGVCSTQLVPLALLTQTSFMYNEFLVPMPEVPPRIMTTFSLLGLD
jgi:hypothetical protein